MVKISHLEDIISYISKDPEEKIFIKYDIRHLQQINEKLNK